jgi:hypothetical protein
MLIVFEKYDTPTDRAPPYRELPEPPASTALHRYWPSLLFLGIVTIVLWGC